MPNKDVIVQMNEQINLEMFSAYLYLEIANYFEEEGLDGFAQWFNVQAQEELDHAELFRTYIHNNDNKVVLKALDDPSRDYKSHMEALEEVLAHEKLITSKINKIYQKSIEANDFRSKQFLDWFIKEQAEEETNAKDLISKYELYANDSRGLYMLNQEFLGREHVAANLEL